MNMFSKALRRRSAKKVLRSRLKEISSLKKGDAVVINDIGVIADSKYLKEVGFLLSNAHLLGVHKEHITVITYGEDEGPFTENTFFSKEDFGWKAQVENEALRNFLRMRYDLLINYFDNDQWPLMLASVKSRVHLRAGLKGVDVRLNDLIIAGDPREPDIMLDELVKYLRILKMIS